MLRASHSKKMTKRLGASPGPVAVLVTNPKKKAGTCVPASGSQEEPGEDPAAAV
jgi:hypothetical protein